MVYFNPIKYIDTVSMIVYLIQVDMEGYIQCFKRRRKKTHAGKENECRVAVCGNASFYVDMHAFC
jgi:hypothetical protein